ncbi:MAG: tetratricopeptide repeat protein [Candidatus Omnitrophota bacterium]
MKAFLACLVIIVVGLAGYANVLGGGFVLDDRYLIKENPRIAQAQSYGELFTQEVASSPQRPYYFYRPLTMLSYAWDYAWWHLDARGYHLTNVLLHILAALALFWCIQLLFGDRILALLSAVLFTAHPIQTECVAYISGRASPLALLLMLLSFGLYLRYYQKPQAYARYVAMLVCYAAALLAHEISLVLPLVLFFYHYTFKKIIRLTALAPFSVLALGYCLVRVIFFPQLFPHLAATTTLLQRVPGFLAAVKSYGRLLFLPSPLHIEYGNIGFGFTDEIVATGMAISGVAALLLYALRKKRQESALFFALGWFVLWLLPVSNLYPLGAYMAERWLYIPVIGFCLTLALALRTLLRRRRIRLFVIALQACLLAFYLHLTIRQNSFWQDPIAFYTRTLKFVPNDAGLYNELALAYCDAQRYKEALPLFRTALELNPQFAEVYYNLGNVYRLAEEFEQAAALYSKSLHIDPYYDQAHNNLGVTYYAMGKNREALLSFGNALALNPRFAPGYFNLGNVYRSLENNEGAIAAYKKAVELDPQNAAAFFNLGNIYQEQGANTQAQEAYKNALRLDPNNARAHNNLAVVSFRQQQYAAAIEHCDKAQKLGFENPALLEILSPYRGR